MSSDGNHSSTRGVSDEQIRVNVYSEAKKGMKEVVEGA